MSSIGGAAVINVIVDNFPTCLRCGNKKRTVASVCLYIFIILFFFSFRTIAVSITMMMGRIGAVIGNLLFPILFDLSCLGPFVMIGTACLSKKIYFSIKLNFCTKQLCKNNRYINFNAVHFPS